ncbi:PREDICTED: uncharacterized protein LOC18587506 [Theobroma cacao]|uniref:Uncharacterized protein LOC18587506 n=1 Tax=Theobroma cacao TaxID=3641 RepID=A0AB32UN10_THECC|nr:PREDICTED: uncharacterized protein LOC18587506 [Theobroma cacao]
METTALCQTSTLGTGSSPPINKTIKQFPKSFEGRSSRLRMPSRGLGSHGLRLKQRFGRGLGLGCVDSDSGLLAEFERELEAEMKPEEEEWMRVGKLGERCKERKGVVELLECLETEAIMGEDQGKEPTDYNRRAQIFDKSSRVFQALKARSKPSESLQQP